MRGNVRTSPRRGECGAVRLRRIFAWAVAICSITTATTSMSALSAAQAQERAGAVLYIAPHADDEFQFWAQAESRRLDYKIFATMTLGEQTGFCDPALYSTAIQEDLGEAAPEPTPAGRWTESCEAARVESAVRFYETMSETDPTLPGDFGEPETFVLDTGGVELCRTDADGPAARSNCDERLRRVLVFHDRGDRGALVFFNLGDGDLDQQRVSLAIRQLLENRGDWGLAAQLPVEGIVGAYAHEGGFYPCFDYPHPDHIAVHETLWSVDFGSGPQMGATCTLDPRRSLTREVSAASRGAASTLGPHGERIGAHNRFYGWLHADVYPFSRFSEQTLFHRLQSYWVRFNDSR